jgi:hypothetical protein
MLGALIALVGAAVGKIGEHALTAVSAAWTTLLSVGLVVADRLLDRVPRDLLWRG